MKKSEKFTAPSAEDQAALNIKTNSADYGNAGAIQVSFPRYISEQVKRWIPALEELKIQHNDNPLAGDNKGASVQPSDILPSNSTRSYSATAYFAPASSRPNLSVLPGATVQRIVFSSARSTSGNVVATGVDYTHSGQKFTAALVSGGEVIVSGGTVNTPQILELSGIGQKKVLQSAGIKQIVDLPGVGENVQDHVYTAAVWKLKNGSVTLDSLRNDPAFAADQQALYANNQVSILQETVPAIAYLTLPQLVGKAKALKLVAKAAAYVASANVPYKASLWKQLEHLTKRLDSVAQMEVIGIDGFFAPGAPQAGVNYITFLAAQQHSLSRGSIHVQSSDASKAPIIDPKYFTADWDLDVLTAGTSYLRNVANTKIYKANGFVENEVLPGQGVDLTNYSKQNVVTEYHPIGSASLGPKSQGGVVDSSLKVYGTQNVRVADASVIPVHVSAHIQATVYGIAEAAAAIIHNKWTYLQ
ncbi:alcohol oxidase [Ceraceosorus guamensis]|uniref:Alcohol oxidase n=1 Tax=Ceraceosorus guamensis TaxID=1522189 RepID=A0A316VVK5_9BASI|nr:alcohol oxidase [Ceraceosorus guamensis]PWN41677.1 alcohol oxidase [Ceraceosorus guamensis]